MLGDTAASGEPDHSCQLPSQQHTARRLCHPMPPCSQEEMRTGHPEHCQPLCCGSSLGVSSGSHGAGTGLAAQDTAPAWLWCPRAMALAGACAASLQLSLQHGPAKDLYIRSVFSQQLFFPSRQPTLPDRLSTFPSPHPAVSLACPAQHVLGAKLAPALWI